MEQQVMHDKCKSVILFHNNLCKFFKSLKGILPECQPQIRAAMTSYKSVSRVEYLKRIQACLGPHIQRVSEYDEGIFTDDYVRGPLNLLPDLDFKNIWAVIDGPEFQEDVNLRASTARSIFNHLQTVYVSSEMALAQVSAFDRALDKQKEFLMNMLGNLKLDEQLKEKVEEMRAQEAASDTASPAGGLGGLLAGVLGGGAAGAAGAGAGIADIFNGEDGEENFIYKLAKEIADELDMGAEEITDPVSAITSLFAEDGRKMRELIVSVGEKLDSKVKSGEFDVERLRTDAMAMKEKLEKAVPGLQNLIPGMKDGDGPGGLVKLAYDSLDAEAKERWNTIPDILQRPVDAWSPEERQTVDDFCRAQVEQEKTGTAEDNLPEEEVKAPPRPSRGAGKGRGKRRAAK